MSDLMKIDVALKGYDTALSILNSAIDAINEAKAIVLQYGSIKHEILACGEGELTAQPETANIIVGKSRDGMTMWYQCDNCNEPVDEKDLYCRGCGRRFEHGSN